MTVIELKKILADLRDDMEVWVYEEGVLTNETEAKAVWIKDKFNSNHWTTLNLTSAGNFKWTEADGAKEVLIVSL